MSAVVVEAVEVRDREIHARVRVTDPALVRTSARPDLAERAVQSLPGLVRHTCENDEGAEFTRELLDTESAHLLEHVTVELAALAGSPRSLRAATAWDFSADGQGVFRLRFAYDDDLVVLGALREAVTVVDWLLTNGGKPPDVEAITARLRELRRR